MDVNYYEVLEIPSDADEREIKRAYHRLARELHPDKASSPEEARRMEERFALVSAAYNTLKDAIKRAEHDRRLQNLQGQGPTAAPPPRKVPATTAVLQAGRGVPSPSGATASAAAPVAPPKASEATGRPGAMGITPQRIAIAQKAFARGMQFYKEGNYLKAIEFFEAAIQNNDTEPLYHARLASALIQARKSATRAIAAAQKAIELDPYNLEHKFTLAGIYATIGSRSNAQKVYEEILRWDAGNTRALSALAELKRKNVRLGFGAPPEGDRSATGWLARLVQRFKG